MICDKKKLIYIHIPRCAGKTIEKVFFGKNSRRKSADHRTYNEYTQAVDDISKYTTYSVVRNPWDRMHSNYRYFLKYYGNGYRRKIGNMRSFEAFINTHCLRDRSEQMFYLIDENGDVAVDHIYKFEKFGKAFDEICKLHRVKEDIICLNHIEADHHYSKFYTDELRDFVGERYKKEIEYFGYEFEDKR